MATARVDEEIKRDNISEENLLLQEDASKNDIIRNNNFKSHDAESTKSKGKGEKEKPKGEKEKPKGEKEKPKGEKEKPKGEEKKSEEETPAVRSEQDDQEDHRIFGLCRSGQCL